MRLRESAKSIRASHGADSTRRMNTKDHASEGPVFSALRAVRTAICTVMSISIILMPTWAFGSETNMSALGHEAQSFGKDIAGKVGTQAMQGDKLTFTMPDGSQMAIKQDDLYGKTGKSGSHISSSTTVDDIEKLQGVYNTNDEMNSLGGKAKEYLYADADKLNKGETSSLEGYVYSVLNDTYLKRPDIDMSSDPLFNKTYEVIGDLENIVAGFADCSAETILKENADKKHLPDYKHCTQVMDKTGTCTLHHNYAAGIIIHHSGPYNLDTCGTGCALLWIGRVGDNYWGGHCKIYEQNTIYKMVNPGSVKKAVLEYAKWDDYMQVLIGPPGKEVKVWSGPNGNFPPETGGACELSTSWSRNPNLDVTKYFKNVEHGALVNFKIRASVTGGGEAFGRIRIYYEPTKTIYEESWSPKECLDTLNALNDGFAEGHIECTDMPATDKNGCITDNGIIVCPKDMTKPPHPSINPLCKKMAVTTNWDFYKGQMDCWKDAHGNIQCPQNVGGKLDTCDAYEKDPNCQFIRSTCTDGANGGSVTCYVKDVTYDCGKDVVVTDKWADTQYKCPGDIACVGNDCIDTSNSVSTSFGKVTALLNAMQYMTEDMTCTGRDEDGNFTHDEDVVCNVFGGEAGECKIAVGGVSDCCASVPGGVGLNEYIKLIKEMSNLNSTLNDMAKFNSDGEAMNLAGQYVKLKDGIGNLITQSTWYKDYFSSPVDAITAGYEKIFGPADLFIEELKNKVKQKCEEMLTKIFAKAGMGTNPPIVGGAPGQQQGAQQTAQQGAQNATQTAGQAFMGNLATVFTVVSWIYTAYVVATMIIQKVYSCEDKEFELVSNRDMGNCHFIGSYCKSKKLGMCIEKRQTYCCYQSPLSRIMNEQIRKQGDILGVEFDGFGTPREPKCAGIPLEKVDKVDWDRIDLSEWIALLDSTGNLPNDTTISIESLTGKGSELDVDGDRLNTIERMLKRLEGTNVDEARTVTGQELEVDRGYVKK